MVTMASATPAPAQHRSRDMGRRTGGARAVLRPHRQAASPPGLDMEAGLGAAQHTAHLDQGRHTPKAHPPKAKLPAAWTQQRALTGPRTTQPSGLPGQPGGLAPSEHCLESMGHQRRPLSPNRCQSPAPRSPALGDDNSLHWTEDGNGEAAQGRPPPQVGHGMQPCWALSSDSRPRHCSTHSPSTILDYENNLRHGSFQFPTDQAEIQMTCPGAQDRPPSPSTGETAPPPGQGHGTWGAPVNSADSRTQTREPELCVGGLSEGLGPSESKEP